MKFHVFRLYFAFTFFSVLFGSILIAQTTVITGKIYDAGTSEPMPFVNVILLGTQDGAVSDFDGNYTVTTNAKADSIRAQYIG